MLKIRKSFMLVLPFSTAPSISKLKTTTSRKTTIEMSKISNRYDLKIGRCSMVSISKNIISSTSYKFRKEDENIDRLQKFLPQMQQIYFIDFPRESLATDNSWASNMFLIRRCWWWRRRLSEGMTMMITHLNWWNKRSSERNLKLVNCLYQILIVFIHFLH